MKIYRDSEKDLNDCESTMNVTSKIGSLITAMTARSSQNSLSIGSRNYDVSNELFITAYII